MKKISLGSVKLKNPLFLAPMVDVTDLSYRLLCRNAGAAIAYTEMLHVESILHDNPATRLKMLTNKKDSPLGVQITGKEVKHFAKVIPALRDYDVVDLNCGCPGHLTIDHGSGSYLLNDPDKIAHIIQVLKDSGLVVSAKIRLGYKKHNALEVAKKIERAGADALTVHARLASEGRGVKANWSWFTKLKKHIGIPLVGNGDVFSAQDARKVLDICDGVMIARGAIGDPLIFKRILAYLEKGKEEEFEYKKNLKLYLEYLNLAKRYNLLKLGKAKYLGGKFLRGFNGAPQQRDAFMRLEHYEEMKEFFRQLL